jgi:hypothetical protein
MLRGDSLYKANTDYNDHKDTCKRCKLRQREQVFNGGSYFYVSAANDFLKSSTDPSKPKPAGICKWELDVVNNFPIQFPYGFGGPLLLDLLCLTTVHFQCHLLLAMFARFLDLENLVHQPISS